MTSTPTQIIRIAVVLGLGLAVGLIIRSGFRSNHDDHDHASHKMSGMETKVQAPPEFGFINKIMDYIRLGILTPEQGSAYLARPCTCGAFNPIRATELLQRAQPKE